VTASASSSSPARSPERVTTAIDAPLPPLPAAWLAGRDRDLLSPLRLLTASDDVRALRPPARPPDRRALAAGLERANRSYGHPRASELAARLADPAARVVVTGQQPGLFGGPLLVLLKMAAAARWAEEIETAGSPAVAVFWVATEDHDWDEAAWAGFAATDGLHRLTLGPDPHPLAPLGMRTLGVGVDAALAELAQRFPYEPFGGWIATMARFYRADARFGEAFSRLAVAMLGPRTPLLLDAQLPELKAAQRPWMRALVERREEVAAGLAGAERRIGERGHTLQVSPAPGTAPLFVLNGGERRRVAWAGEGWAPRGADGSQPIDELLALIDGNPAAVSPNVLSRPPIQDAVLGTALQVMGPGELSYLAQAAPLYSLLGVEAPLVAQRPRALVVEARQLAGLAELGLDPALLLAGEDALTRALAERQDGDPLPPVMARVLAEVAALRAPAVALDANLERPWEKTQETVRGALERFGEKLTRARAGRDQVAQRRANAVRDAWLPEGTLHERVLAGAYFRGRWGEPFVERLWESLDVREPGLQLLAMD
jgi:bacillithiol biosynthesis cysteine-adding enzyme BshC